MPTSSGLSCQSQVLENTPTPPACACVCEGKWDNLCVNAERSHNAAEQRTQSAVWCEFFRLLQERKGRSMMRHDCMSCWRQQRLNSSFNSRMSVTCGGVSIQVCLGFQGVQLVRLRDPQEAFLFLKAFVGKTDKRQSKDFEEPENTLSNSRDT